MLPAQTTKQLVATKPHLGLNQPSQVVQRQLLQKSPAHCIQLSRTTSLHQKYCWRFAPFFHRPAPELAASTVSTTSVGTSAGTGSSANPSPTPTLKENKTKTDSSISDRNETEFGRKNEIDFTGYSDLVKVDSKMVRRNSRQRINDANHSTLANQLKPPAA